MFSILLGALAGCNSPIPSHKNSGLSNGELPRLSFFVVYENEGDDRRLVNSELLSKPGYIGAQPGLELREIKAVEKAGSLEIDLEMGATDAVVLHELTRQNVGRRLLLMLDGEPLMAPYIREAISGRQIRLAVSSRVQLNRVLAALRRMAQAE